MATKTMNVRVSGKRDTLANWTNNNPVLLSGEVVQVIMTDGTLRHKTGNGTNTFTQEAWDLCLEIGNLVWEELIEYFGWNPNGPFTAEQQAWFKPGDVFAAYFVQDPDGRDHAKDIIVVGRDDGQGNKPGPILKV